MLGSMVCVLTLGRDRRTSKDCSHPRLDKYSLLPQGSSTDQIRLDNYIRLYSNLLYCWGLLTARNEISKRLAFTLPEADDFELVLRKSHGKTAAQCSICCSAVRGASAFCPSCGHGGHLEHLIQWFGQNQTCPTGCGCVCMASTNERSVMQ
jgi:hypothetical protein